MKKKFWITIASLAVVVIFGIVVYQLSAQQANAQLTRDEVSKMVTDLYPGEITGLELADNDVYEVEVQTGANAYQLSVDSQSGEVLALTETEATNNPPADNKEGTEQSNQNTQNQERTEQAPQEQEDTDSNESDSNQQALLSQERINEIALNEFPGTIVGLELDEDDDRLIYEIEIVNKDEEATVEIDAYTGEVVMLEIDRED